MLYLCLISPIFFCVKSSQDIIDQVKSTVITVDSAVAYANETLANIQLDLRTVCPNYVNAEQLGINLNELTTILREKSQALETVGEVNMTKISTTLATIQNGINRVRVAADTTEQKIWVFPLTLLVVFITVTAMLVAVVLAWTGKTSSSFEKKMAYGVLP